MTTFKWTAKEFIIATLKGVSQVTFVENWKTGIFWVVGLTLSFETSTIYSQDRLDHGIQMHTQLNGMSFHLCIWRINGTS